VICEHLSPTRSSLSVHQLMVLYQVVSNRSASTEKVFYRATRMHSAVYAVARCSYVRPSHAGILSKRLYMYVSSKCFHHR